MKPRGLLGRKDGPHGLVKGGLCLAHDLQPGLEINSSRLIQLSQRRLQGG
jgi:hypothetical protein